LKAEYREYYPFVTKIMLAFLLVYKYRKLESVLTII